MADDTERAEGGSLKQYVLGFLGAIGIGAIGSGVWEVAAKPSLSWLSRQFLTAISLGSEAFRDQAYIDAAMDPTSTASMASLLSLKFLPFYFLMPLFFGVAKQRGDRPAEVSSEFSQDDLLRMHARLKKRLRILRRAIAVMAGIMLLAFGYELVAHARLSQSVQIWSTFNNNMMRLSTVLQPEERAQLQSRFASITGRADYMSLDAELRARAERSGIKLSSPTLVW